MSINPRNRRWALGLLLVIAALWLVKYASESEMRRLDREMDRLCAIDGKSVVYETVRLPAEKFNQHGQPLVPYGRDEKGFGYFYRGSERTLMGPAENTGAARLVRHVWQIVRSGDGKVIAEHIFYVRGGGDWLRQIFWIGRGRACPGPVPTDFDRQVFTPE